MLCLISIIGQPNCVNKGLDPVKVLFSNEQLFRCAIPSNLKWQSRNRYVERKNLIEGKAFRLLIESFPLLICVSQSQASSCFAVVTFQLEVSTSQSKLRY